MIKITKDILYKVLVLMSIVFLFFLRDYKSKEYLEQFKTFPSSSQQGEIFIPIQIPFWVDINVQDDLGYSFIHYAVFRSDISTLKQLLNKRATVDLKINSGKTPLHLSAFYGQILSMKILLNSGAHINALDQYHKTPIMYAVERGAILSVKLLLIRGANLLLTDNDHRHLIDFCIEHQYRDILLYLLKFLAPSTQIQKLEIISFLDNWKEENNKIFNIKPIFSYGFLEYQLAQFGFLFFTKAEERAIQIYLYKRQVRKNPEITFFWGVHERDIS